MILLKACEKGRDEKHRKTTLLQKYDGKGNTQQLHLHLNVVMERRNKAKMHEYILFSHGYMTIPGNIIIPRFRSRDTHS